MREEGRMRKDGEERKKRKDKGGKQREMKVSDEFVKRGQ